MQESPRVTVVVPAYNAAGTLGAALDSACAQSLADFELLIIDDGSVDDTASLAARFAARDARIRVIGQANSGVADARNRGLREARAPFVACLDADDLWHETFLEKLAARLEGLGPSGAFAYAGFRLIDMAGRVTCTPGNADFTGVMFHQFLLRNFVGNGSGMMFRRDLALALGGYERRLLHEFKAQGCEDWLLQMRLAAHGLVASVPEYLVGYRTVPGAMSTNYLKMRRSRLHALDIFRAELGELPRPVADWAIAGAQAECFVRELAAGKLSRAATLLAAAATTDWRGTLDVLIDKVAGALQRTGSRLAQGLAPTVQTAPAQFLEVSPAADWHPYESDLLGRRLRCAAALDRAARRAPRQSL